MDEITVHYKDGTHFYTNNIISVVYIGGELIILSHGIFGGYDTKIIDDTLIKNYEVKLGKK